MKRGFSLVELLVVVLVISILAAIAVPNFLGAQIRAKISKSKSDMKALDTGCKQLQLDLGVMLVDDSDLIRSWGPVRLKDVFNNVGVSRGDSGRALYPLTTPIAYLSQLPRDPFVNDNVARMLIVTHNIKFNSPVKTYGYYDNDPFETTYSDEFPFGLWIRRRSDSRSLDYIMLQEGEYSFFGFGPHTNRTWSDNDEEFAFAFPVLYNVTNGLQSSGVMMFVSNEGFL